MGALSLMVGTGMAAQMAPAFAVPVSIDQNEQQAPGATDGSEYWNRFTLSDGTVAFCNGDPQNPGDLGAKVYDTDNYTTAQGDFTALGGSHWTAEATQQAAYILAVHGKDADPGAVQYAVMSLADPYYPGDARGLSAAQVDQAKKLKEEAAQEAPKYANFQLATPTIDVDNANSTATLHTNLQAGNYNVTYNITGVGTFEDGSTTKTVNAADAGDLKIVIPEGSAAGDINVQASSDDIPDTAFKILESANYQDLFIAGSTISATAAATAAFVPVAPTPETTPPTVSTVASDDVELKDGKAQIFDTLTVKGDVPEGAYARVELHYFGDENAPAKCDANTLQTTSKDIPVSAAGEYKTENFEVTKAGKYGFVETLFDKDNNVLHKGDCATESEHVIVKDVPTSETPAPTPTPEVVKPSVSTVASDDVELKDGKAEIFDTAKVEGDVEKGSVLSVNLYKLSDNTDESALVGNEQCTEDNIVKTLTDIPVDAAGNYTTEKVTVTEAGVYGFVETLKDANGNIIDQGGCGEVSEHVVVKEAPKTETPAPTPSETPKSETPVTPETPKAETPAAPVEQHQVQTQQQSQNQVQQQNATTSAKGATTTQSAGQAAPARAVTVQTDAKQQDANVGGIALAIATMGGILIAARKRIASIFAK